MASFLHAADLHLGMRVTRFEPATAKKVREARITALDNILKKARDLKVDFVLIAGDLFDDSAVEQLTAQRAFDMLDSLPMPVFVLPGNHDPLLARGVWDRPPWNECSDGVCLLKEPRPTQAADAILFPCPVLRKTCMDDPTTWIAQSPRANGVIRIGVAHGSLKTRDDLPPDDHLIERYACDNLGLDYLALGHWHKQARYAARDGAERTAYPGVHEPMRFCGSAECRTGWVPYGGAGRSEFLDDGKGEVLHVRIKAPGEPPEINALEVGHYQWQEEAVELSCKEELDRLISAVANRADHERRLLRLSLSGILDAENMMRLDALREILANRYVLGELDAGDLRVRPTDEETRAAAGHGVLRKVMEKLEAEAVSTDPAIRQVAERALVLLYQISKEAAA